MNFQTVLFMFPFLFYWSHLKVCTANLGNSSLFCKRSIIGKLNIPAATAENEEKYTCSNIIYIRFQNSYSFFEVFFDKQLFLKGKQLNWKILVAEFIFRQSCRLSCDWLVVWKMTWGIWQFFARTILNLKIGIMMGSFNPK